ncbi:MAG: MBL fold metallo-hydrolase, partial [Eubacteriales bacterium]|nr:MBL fold metallo-hydrolase [Eubacteriales bacterium]
IRLNDFLWIAASGWAGSNFSDPFDCDVYMVDTGDGLVLVDAGVGPCGDAVLDSVRACGFTPADVKLILLTHGHADHSGNAFHLHETTGAPVKAHTLCAKYVTQGDTEAIALKGAVAAGLYPADYRFTACPVAPIADGETFRIGCTSWQAVDTPGHCSGHMSYLMERNDRRYLFAGDSIFVGGKITLQNIWDCSITNYAATAEKLCGLDFEALLPSHFGIDLTQGKTHVEKAASIFRALSVPPQANR